MHVCTIDLRFAHSSAAKNDIRGRQLAAGLPRLDSPTQVTKIQAERAKSMTVLHVSMTTKPRTPKPFFIGKLSSVRNSPTTHRCDILNAALLR